MTLRKAIRILSFIMLILIVSSIFTGNVFAQDDPTVEEQIATLTFNLDTVWMLVAGFLVFFMQAGFALVEAGFVRARNVTNIMMKNFFDLAIGAIGFWAIGYGIMFGESAGGFIGTSWFFLNGIPEVYPGLNVPSYAFFFFQFAFAATAATIASGAMAERTEFSAYIFYSVLVTGVIYPIVGHWTWGGGWLNNIGPGFSDFAGSTIVHSTGGWIGLMGAIMLGARKGRFGPNSIPMPGHSMTLAALGTFILWLGWFGFNPGSQLDATGSEIARITVTTNLAAGAGALVAMFLGWGLGGKPQLPWGLNGALAGLVSITAPTAAVSPTQAVIIGAIGGSIMYFGVGLLERLKIDDPIGAVPVHGFCGVWGTLAVGIFGSSAGMAQLGAQAVGIVSVAAFVLVSAGIMFSILKATVGLRVSEEGEELGLDIYEHGMVNYPEFTNSPSEPVQMG